QDLVNNANSSARPKPADVTFRGPDPQPGAGVPQGGRVQCDVGYKFVGYTDLTYWLAPNRQLHLLCPTYVRIGGCRLKPGGGDDKGDDKGDDGKPTTSFGSGDGPGGGGSTIVRTSTPETTQTTQTTQTTYTTFQFTQTTFTNTQVT